MKCAGLVLSLAVVLGTAPAWADAPIPEELQLTPPAAWDFLPVVSKRLAAAASGRPVFYSKSQPTAGSAAFGDGTSGALYLTWHHSKRTETDSTAPSDGQQMRTAIDGIFATPYLANSAANIREIRHTTNVRDRIIELEFVWEHVEDSTHNRVRALGWLDSAGLHLAIAECVVTTEAIVPKTLCIDALKSLALTSKQHVATLVLPPPPDTIAQNYQVPKLVIGSDPSGATMSAPPAQIGKVLYTGAPKPQKDDKSNQIIIGIGVLLLAIAIWLSLRSKTPPEDPAT